MTPYLSYRLLMVVFFLAFVINFCNYFWYVTSRAYPRQKNDPEHILRQTLKPSSAKELGLTKTSQSTLDPDQFHEEDNTDDDTIAHLLLCPEVPPGLGVMPSLEETLAKAKEEYHLALVKRGGYFEPECKPQQSVAVIVPFKTPYDRNFGGSIAISHAQFHKINGFPNTLIQDEKSAYNNLLKRIEASNYAVESAPENLGTFESLKNDVTRDNTETVHTTKPYAVPAAMSLADGLTTLHYHVDKSEYHSLYCVISVTLLEPYPDHDHFMRPDEQIIIGTHDANMA